MAKAEMSDLHADDMPPEKDTVEAPQQEEKVYAGKFKSPDDLASAYQELEKKLGQQGDEFGKLKAEREALAQQLEQTMQVSKQREDEALSQEPPTDYEQMLREVSKAYEDGDINFQEALLKTNAITAQQTEAKVKAETSQVLERATSQFQEELQKRDSQAVVKEFYKENPDFEEYQKSGKLDEVMQSDRLADEYSAYWRLKAQTAFEEGMKKASRIAEGSEQTGKVLADPGTSMQSQNKAKPQGETAMKQSMLAALNNK